MPGGLGLTGASLPSMEEEAQWRRDFERAKDGTKAMLRREQGPWELDALETWIMKEFQVASRVAEFVLSELKVSRVLVQVRIGSAVMSQIHDAGKPA